MTTETGVNNSPTLIKRDVTTEVSLADGDIILLGGLAEQKDSKASSGWSFFGSRTSESNKTDIMVMLQVRKVDRSRATPRSAARSGELFRDNLVRSGRSLTADRHLILIRLEKRMILNHCR